MCETSHVIKMFIWQSFMQRLLLLEHQFYQTEEVFCLCKSILREDQNKKKRMTQRQAEGKEGLEVREWGEVKQMEEERWRRKETEREVMGSGAVPGFHWRLGLALARKDKREIIIRPAEAWQPLLGTAERKTEHYVKDWPCHRRRHLLTDSGIWSFTWRKNPMQQAARYLPDQCLVSSGGRQDVITKPSLPSTLP